ncbi:hypothetical protein ACJX0J_032586, partial [Zea mays]
MNECLLAKWIWKIVQGSEHMWIIFFYPKLEGGSTRSETGMWSFEDLFRTQSSLNKSNVSLLDRFTLKIMYIKHFEVSYYDNYTTGSFHLIKTIFSLIPLIAEDLYQHKNVFIYSVGHKVFPNGLTVKGCIYFGGDAEAHEGCL